MSSKPATPSSTTTTRETESAPVAKVDARKLSEVASSLTLLVKDEAIINELLRSPDSPYIQEGQVIRGVYSLNRRKTFCFLERNNTSYEVRNGDVINLANVRSNGSKVAIVSGDTKAAE